MTRTTKWILGGFLTLAGVSAVVTAAIAVDRGASARVAQVARARRESRAERGRFLVNAMGCIDCHTPLQMGPNGPERDMSRHLSGHPEQLQMPAAPTLPPGPWAFISAGTMTAWNGPWGTSYTANLTPDPETGLGRWTEQQFIDTIRTGRHLGRGRPILPPMPMPVLQTLPDEDLRAIFAHLRTLRPVHNRVPTPVPPPEPPRQASL